jgi:polysaccharide deacetylase family protein (PEP-CTERM system associated)
MRDPVLTEARVVARSPIALTVDVEGDLARVEAETREVLELFSGAGIRGTFFVLGEVAEAHPGLVRAIAADDHEVGFHGYRHDPLSALGPTGFAAELREWLPRLEDLAQVRVRGYRAPSFSIRRETSSALGILASASVEFDSSLFPGVHPRYGWFGAPTAPVRLAGTRLRLFPVPLLSRWIPIGYSGGRWLSTLPFALVQRGLAREAAAGHAGMVYLHPWQLAEQRERVRHLLATHEGRLRPMGEVLAALPGIPEWDPGAGSQQ